MPANDAGPLHGPATSWPGRRTSLTILHSEPSSYEELEQLLAAGIEGGQPVGVAVDAIVLDGSGYWLLHRRGDGCRDEVGRLEGLGGGLESGEDPRAALAREIREEAGEDIDVEIDRFIAGRVIHARDGGDGERPWIVISYLCRLRSGEPVVTEPDKNAGFVRIRPVDVDTCELSASAHAAWRWLCHHAA